MGYVARMLKARNTEYYLGNLKRKDHLIYIDVGERIILKCILHTVFVWGDMD
jgi:hypothetical protein